MSDVQWNTIAPQLPKPAKTGRPRTNDRNIINAILFNSNYRLQMGKHARQIRLKIYCISDFKATAKRNLEKDPYSKLMNKLAQEAW